MFEQRSVTASVAGLVVLGTRNGMMFCGALRTEHGRFRHTSELLSGRSERSSFPFLLWSYSSAFSVVELVAHG